MYTIFPSLYLGNVSKGSHLTVIIPKSNAKGLSHLSYWYALFINGNFPGRRFETDSYSDTDSTKLDFDLSNQTPQRLLEVLSSKLLCDAIFPAWPGESNVPCFANGHFSLISLSLAAKVFKIHEILV